MNPPNRRAKCTRRRPAALELHERPVDERNAARSKGNVAEAIDPRTRELLGDPFLTIAKHTHAEEVRANDSIVRAGALANAQENERRRQRCRGESGGGKADESLRPACRDDGHAAREMRERLAEQRAR